MKQAGKWRLIRPFLWLWPPALILLWWAFGGESIKSLGRVLLGLDPRQMALLLLINLAILLLFSSRWWLLLRAMGYRIPYFSLTAYRVAAFSVSYFTPGPQFGGEPLQVLFLQRRHGVPASAAISSVFLDKLLELLANFTFLILGLLVIITGGIAADWFQPWVWLPALSVLLLPGLHMLALRRGRHPFSEFLARLKPDGFKHRFLQKGYEVIQDAERRLADFFMQKPLALLQSVFLSGLIWLALIGEYYLMLSFAGLKVDLSQTVMALTSMRLALLTPLPGGLGAVEASQVLALKALGFSSAEGLLVSLILRGRDFVVGGLGLWINGWLFRPWRAGYAQVPIWVEKGESYDKD